MGPRYGFTLIEMIIFVAIFALAMVAFTTIFTSVTSVAVRQSSGAEVNAQSQFVLQTVQYYVERASLIEMPADTVTTTLRLRMASSSEDPVVLTLNGSRLQLQVGGGSAQDITSSQVAISNLAFTKHANTGGHDSVALSFTISAVTSNPALRFARSLQTGAARVSAATFDSDVVPTPGSGGAYELGTSLGDWKSINHTLFFSGSKVGVGVTPTQKLQVTGGDVYVDTSGNGIILKNGSSCYRLTVTSSGVPTTTSVSCT